MAGSSANPATPLGGSGANDIAQVSEMLKVLGRAVRAHQLYMPNNPMHARALDALRESLMTIWTSAEIVRLSITEDEFLYDDIAVYAEGGRGGESLPWMFYKDGIRSLEIRKGFEGQDLPKFLDALKVTRNRGSDDDDLVTLFWECDFANLGYEYVEAGGDGQDAPGAELLRGSPRVGETTERPDSEREAGVDGASASPFARIADFDPTLYFLDDSEVAYLQNAIQADFAGDLRPSVIAALLDTFEANADADVRDEICAILESFLIKLLSTLELHAANYLLQEAHGAITRTADVLPQHRERIAALVQHMSDPQVVEQLLNTLDDAPVIPAPDDFVALLGQLEARALGPVVSRHARTQNAQLRPLLNAAAARIAASSTAELTRLIESEDEIVALEAARRAGELRVSPAVTALARLLGSSNVEMRRVATTALGEIGSAGAMHALERCVEDPDRAVRISSVTALAQRQHRASLPRLERALRGQVLRDGNAAERTAFFDAYAALGGDAAIAFLEGVLNPRGFMARKGDAGTRAAAATALGRMGTPSALDALRRAAADKEVVVRAAATRALRGPA